MNIERFTHSILWFSTGLVLNRIKYILLSIIVLRLGVINLVVFYLTVRIVTEFASFINRYIGANYNQLLRDETSTPNTHNRNLVINDSLTASAILGSVFGILVFTVAQPIGQIIKSDLLAQAIKLFSLSIPFIVTTNQIIQILVISKRFKEVVLFQYILETALVLSLAYLSIFIFKANVLEVLVWQVIANVSFFPVALLLLKKTIKTWHPKISLLSSPIKLTGPVIYNPLAVGIFGLVDLLIIGVYLDPFKLGLYIAMLVGPQLIFAIATNMFAMFYPFALSISKDSLRLKLIAQKVLLYILILATPLTLMLLIFPHETVKNILKIHVPVDPLITRLLTVAFFIKIIGWMAERVLIVKQVHNQNMWINLLLAISSIPLLLFITPRFGLLGVAFVFLILFSLEAFAKTVLAYFKTSIHFISPKSIRLILLGILIYILNSFVLVIGFNLFLLTFPFTFTLGIILLKCLDKRDLATFVQRFQGAIKTSAVEQENQ